MPGYRSARHAGGRSAVRSFAVLDHVAQCSACSEELKRVCDDGTLRTLTAALQADSACANSLSNEARHSGRRRSVLGGLALAASLVVAVAVTWIILPPQEIPTLRGGSPVEGLVPQSGAVLDRPPAEFRWPASGAAEALVLMNAEAEVLWTAPAVRDGVLEVPAAVRDGLEPGRYYWQVRGLERDALLGPFEFHLEPAR